MKLIIIIISSFVLITTVQSSLNNDNGKFDYFMFENFPQNEENFKQELKLVNVLKDYSHKLKTWRATIKIHLEQFKSRIAIGNHLPISFFHILRISLNNSFLMSVYCCHYNTKLHFFITCVC